jgi:hypothetical protein
MFIESDRILCRMHRIDVVRFSYRSNVIYCMMYIEHGCVDFPTDGRRAGSVSKVVNQA